MIGRTKKLFTEGLLIVFSVLFALLITQLVDSNKVRKRKDQALNNIYTELSINKNILEGWIDRHSKMLRTVTNMLETPNDSLKKVLSSKNFFDFSLFVEEKTFVDALLSSTAWESAKSTQIISEFDFSTVQDFTRIYELQAILQDESIRKFTNAYFDRETHDLSNLQSTLLQFQLIMSEIVGQEQTLKYMLDQTITEDESQKKP